MATLARDAGFDVTLVDLKATKRKQWPAIDAFDAFIVGSSIKMGRWVKHARKFLALATETGKPVAAFVSCGTAAEDRAKAQADYLTKKWAKWGCSPTVADAFGPVYDFSPSSNLGWMALKIMRLGIQDMVPEVQERVDPQGRNDLRDWDRIDAFTRDFLASLRA